MKSIIQQEFKILQHNNFENVENLNLIFSNKLQQHNVLSSHIKDQKVYDHFIQPKKTHCFLKKCFYDSYSDYYPNYKYNDWQVVYDRSNYQYNIQSCDILFEQFFYFKKHESLNLINRQKQIINFLTCDNQFTHKNNLFNNLIKYDKNQQQSKNYPLNSYNFTVPTYNLYHNSSDSQNIKNVHNCQKCKEELYDNHPFLKISAANNILYTSPWIFKPVSSYGGTGIKIFKNFIEAQKFYKKQLKYDQDKKSYQVQQFVTDLNLYKNQKFHLRQNLFIAWNEKDNNLVYISNGQLLTTFQQYNPEVTNNQKKNAEQHLTNFSVQSKVHEKSDKKDEEFSYIITLEEYKEYLITEQNYTQEKFEEILQQINLISAYIANSVLDQQQYEPGYAVYGLDFILSQDRPIFLESNQCAGMPRKNEEFKLIKEVNSFTKKVLDLETKIFDLRQNGQDLKKEFQKPEYQNYQNLRLLRNDSVNYNYLDEYYFRKNKKL